MMITIMMIIVFNKHIWDDYPLPLGKIFRVVKNHERLRARWELFASGCFPNVWATGVFFFLRQSGHGEKFWANKNGMSW